MDVCSGVNFRLFVKEYSDMLCFNKLRNNEMRLHNFMVQFYDILHIYYYSYGESLIDGNMQNYNLIGSHFLILHMGIL